MSLPTTNITTSMVSSAIGLGSNDVGALCSSSNVNKWSKWKPVSYQSNSPINDSILSSIKYGIDVQSFTSITDLVNYYLSNIPAKYTYSKPLGGITSPYRIGDFRGYNHSAVRPISGNTIPSSLIRDNSYLYLSLSSNNQSSYDVSYSDLGLGSYFFGYYVVSGNGIQYIFTYPLEDYITVSISENKLYSSITNFDPTASTYTIYPLICNISGLNTTNISGLPSNITFMPIDGLSKSTVLLIDSYSWAVNDYYWQDGNTVYYSFTLTNNTSSNYTFTSVKVAAKANTSAWSDPLLTGEGLVNLNNLTISPNSSQTFTGTIPATQIDFSSWKFCFHVDNPSISFEIRIDS